jgi:hypothetical protein
VARDASGAAPAAPEDLVAVSVDLELQLGRDLVLQSLDLGARELDDVAAAPADEVVVVLALVFALETALALELSSLASPAAWNSFSVR